MWQQFSCPDCVNLEFYYQAYVITGESKFQFTKIIQGKVDYSSFEMETHGTQQTIVKVRRTPDNTRKRPNGQNRHDPYNQLVDE